MNGRGIPGRRPAGRDLYGGGRGGMVVVGVAAGRGGRCGSIGRDGKRKVGRGGGRRATSRQGRRGETEGSLPASLPLVPVGLVRTIPSSNNNTLLDRLPLYTLATVMKYLSIRDLARLDTALCTHGDIRQIFIEALTLQGITIKGPLRLFSRDSAYYVDLRWTIKRRIPISNESLTLEGVSCSDDLVIIALATYGGNLPNLKSLHISCRNITDSSIFAISRGNLTNLQSLTIDRCRNITDSSVLSLACSNLRNLRSLTISHCEITNCSLTAFATYAGNLTNLRSLNIQGCENITSVRSLATDNLTNLQSLDISGNSHISYTSLIALVTGSLPNLQSLNIGGCWNIISNLGQEGGHDILKESRPNLKIEFEYI